jgi:Ni/Co efflux regulator RcnB
MNKLIFVSLAFAATMAASGAQAQASNHDAARSAPPGRGAVDDVNQNNVPDQAEGGGRWWPWSGYAYEGRPQALPVYPPGAATRGPTPRDRDGDGVRNNRDRHPDDPRYQ